MINTKERLIVIGGCGLAFLSAALNIEFLIKTGTSVSHLTGDLSRIAPDLIQGKAQMMTSALSLIIATVGFVLGAVLAGFTIHQHQLEFSKPYGRTLLVISGCVLCAFILQNTMQNASIFFAAFACGLQNAMATTYKGLILRTTHMTGILTDLGSNLGMKIRGTKVPIFKIIIPVSLCISFISGSLFGAVMDLYLKQPILLWLAIFYLIGGIIYVITKPQLMKLSNTS